MSYNIFKFSGDLDKWFDIKVKKDKDEEDIAPVKTEERTGLFKSGRFADGYDAGDVSLTMLNSSADLQLGVVEGVGNMAEGITDLLLYGVAGVSDLFGADNFADKTKKAAQKTSVSNFIGGIRENTGIKDNSIWGDFGYGVAQGVGQVAAVIATGGIAGAAGASGAAASAITTGAMGLSSMGAGMGEAYQSGATDEEAVKYGVAKGVIDAGTELIFGGLGKGVKALGISKGLTSVDDMFAKKLSSKISNQFFKNATEYGVKATAEGVEELLAGLGSAAAKKLTYMSDEELGQLIEDENLLEQFATGVIVSGIAQGGDFVSSTKSGRDFITNLTANEEKVAQAEFESRVAAEEQSGKKLTKKQKNDIYDEVVEDLKKGGISTGTIESVLGGDTYKSYKDTIDSEDAILKEFDELGKKQNATLAEQSRYAELKEKVAEIKNKSNRSQIKSQLSNEVFNLVKENDGYLTESYNENARRGQYFEVDLNKYDGKAKEFMQKLMDSKLANNTRRSHEYFDLAAKMVGDQDMNIDVVDNKRMLELIKKKKGDKFDASVYKGKIVNGLEIDGGIAINVQSAKALNRLVGHEITHSFEKSKAYEKLKNAALQYARTKGVYESLFEEQKTMYEGVYADDGTFTEKVDREVVSEIVGDYLFTDPDFISHLSTKHRNVFLKVFDEIKYFCKIATKGSKEARELEKVKRAFEKVYREGVQSDGDAKYSLSPNARTEVKKALADKNYAGEVRLTDSSPSILLSQKGVRNLPMLMNASHLRENIFTEDEARSKGLKVNPNINYHGLGEDLFLKVIDELDNVTEAYRGTKNAEKTERRENYFLLISQHTDAEGNVINVPVYINEKGLYNRVFIDTNKISTVFGRSELRRYINEQIKKGNLVRIKKGSTQTSESTSPINADYRMDASDGIIPQNSEKSSGNEKLSLSAEQKESMNGAEYNGKEFWLAVADLKGNIVKTWTYDEAEAIGFDAESEVLFNDKLKDGYRFFTTELIEDNGRIEYDDYGEPMPEDMVKRINEQIKVKTSTEEATLPEKIRKLHDEIGTLNKRLSNVTQWVDGARELLEQRANNQITFEEYESRLRKDSYYRRLDDERQTLQKEMDGLVTELEKLEGKPWKHLKSSVLYGVSPKYSLSAEQKEYFKDSVVRDENGNLKVMYHGTSKGGHTVFDTYGSNYGLFGQGSYFTDDKSVAESYTKKGKGNNPQVYESYLNITNPMDMDAEADIKAWMKAVPDADFSNCTTNEDCYRAMEEYLRDEEYSKWEAAEYAMDSLVGMGYDGITHMGGGRFNKADDTRHQVYIAFNPEQIKNIDNVKPTDNPDIRYSMSKDSEGNDLSVEQREFFKDTKALDRNGNLLKVYHTTNNDFTVFDKERKGEATGADNTYLGFFFADDAEYMQNFPEFENGKTDAYYLNMTNPIDMTNISKEAFIDIVEVLGGDVDEAAEIYDQELSDEQDRAMLRGDNNTSLRFDNLMESVSGEYFSYYDFIDELKPHYDELMSRGYDGVVNYLDELIGAKEYIVLDSNQAKLTTNLKPTADADIRYSLSDSKQGDTDVKLMDGGSVTKYSLSTWTPETQTKVRENLIKVGYEADKVDKWIKDTNSVASVIAADKDRLDFVAADNQVMLKDNQEYIKTLDASTLCAKRLVYQGTFDAIQHRMPNTMLSSDDLIDLLNMMKEHGVQTPCGVCYVESRRRHLGKFAQGWLDNYNGEYKPNLDEVTTSDGLEALRKSHPQTYKDFVDAMNKKGSSNPKVVQLRTEYRNEIMSLTPKQIREIESIGGLRVQSFSDFETPHMLDMMQAVMDMSAKGLHSQAYTKVPNFAWVFGDTGIKINLSLIAEGDGFDADGNLAFSSTEGMDINEAMKLRNAYSQNVGTIIVGANDKHILACMADDRIDFIIPFHRSGWGMKELEMMGMSSYTDYTYGQKEHDLATGKGVANLYPIDYWDYTLSGKENAERYLNLCAKTGREPKFSKFLVNNGDGSYSLQPDGSTDGYWKTLIDFKMYDNEGNGAAQQKVLPNFNMDEAYRVLGEYEGGANKLPVANDVVEEFVAKYQSSAMSLSWEDEAPVRRSGNDVFGEDIMYEAPIREDIAKNATTTDDIAPITEDDIAPPRDYEAIKPRPEKLDGEEAQWAKNKMARADKVTEEQKTAEILVEEPEVPKKKSRGWSHFVRNFVDKQSVFETLSLKTKNRKLMGKANQLHNAESSAQWFIGHGTEGVKSLNDIRAEVESTGMTKEFYEYLYHKHNVDRMNLEGRYEDIKNKPVFGYDVTAEASQDIVKQYEFAEPKFKEYAQDVYDYMNHLRKKLVDNGVISQETADLWAKMYPHYVPIRRVGDSGLNINVPLDTGRTSVNAPIKQATGGNRDILPLFDTMAMRTEQTFKAIAKNNFGVELKNTLGTGIVENKVDFEEVVDSIEKHDELLKKGENGRLPTFTVFENGKRVTFEITEDMYDALKPTSEGLAYTNKVLNKASNIRRGLITEYNPVFMATNAIKDVQDVLINSQHAAKTYAKLPTAYKELATKGKWYTEYMENGGEQNTYFDGKSNTFTKEDEGLKKIVGMPLRAISAANNFIERAPRLAEYIASRESGASVEVAMLDAARVTTNFAAGGDVTKLLNRNGATFLNASVQGAMQQVRNVREAKMNGLKGWLSLAAKFAVAALPSMLLNSLLWDDDEDYEELSDYVKDNYYIVAKYDDGKFVRIPKGRTVAVIQDAVEQISNVATGDDEADFKSFLELAISNLAPNNPIDNNILSPIVQVASNKTWYGDDLVPTRLQDLPKSEQYDESTDALSKWLGEKQDVLSPYQINYLLDQYSGGIGDVFLPMMTPEAESGDNSLLGNVIAPAKGKFTTDSVMNNQNIADFYDTMDELATNAKRSGATDEDVLRYKYINSISSDMGDLYAKKREIQNSSLPDDLKYEQVRKVQKQIDALAENSLNAYKNVHIDNGYASVGNRYYRLTDKGEWQKISEKQLENQDLVTSALGISGSEYWSNKSEYDFAYEYPEKYSVAKAVGGYTAYKSFASDLYDIKADKDSNGKPISGSRKEKVIDYINNLDADYGERIILFKSVYTADDTYNYDIIEYLNSRNDISYEETVAILKELGFTVKSDGTVTW